MPLTFSAAMPRLGAPTPACAVLPRAVARLLVSVRIEPEPAGVRTAATAVWPCGHMLLCPSTPRSTDYVLARNVVVVELSVGQLFASG